MLIHQRSNRCWLHPRALSAGRYFGFNTSIPCILVKFSATIGAFSATIYNANVNDFIYVKDIIIGFWGRGVEGGCIGQF